MKYIDREFNVVIRDLDSGEVIFDDVKVVKFTEYDDEEEREWEDQTQVKWTPAQKVLHSFAPEECPWDCDGCHQHCERGYDD